MVYNPDLAAAKELITGILVADLTPTQLDTVQEKFGIGALLCSPYPSHQLFIHDKRNWTSYTHADMLRAMTNEQPDLDGLVVIDARSADDGAAWYIECFADAGRVADGEAENINTLFKLRMKLEEIVLCSVNYKIANIDIREDMDHAGIPYPTPADFDQDEPYASGNDYIGDRYLNPTWVTAAPDEMDETTGSAERDKFVPRPDVVYRLKSEVATANGLSHSWTVGTDAGTRGYKVLQLNYDPENVVPEYHKPEASL
ncbi:hypothetical protein DE146DRAFT_285503 [Phaeosphaeria sp. MPI-PUGE-AT-0046c]|nr:hypothetical protein DE146DRAFT_285503 [Phaeosphaeria sp. MPI-PUGE-AT-0046c]